MSLTRTPTLAPCTLMPWKSLPDEIPELTVAPWVPNSRTPIDRLLRVVVPERTWAEPPTTLIPWDHASVTVTLRTVVLDAPSRKTPWVFCRRVVKPSITASVTLRTRKPKLPRSTSRLSDTWGAGPPRSTYSVRVTVSKNQEFGVVWSAAGAAESRFAPA